MAACRDDAFTSLQTLRPKLYRKQGKTTKEVNQSVVPVYVCESAQDKWQRTDCMGQERIENLTLSSK